jgi:hypothetical protein
MPASQPQVYYSHALPTYRQPIETRALRRIAREFPDFQIVNPLEYDWHPMPFWLGLVDQCEMVVFSRLEGQITGGVGLEVNHALKSGKLVFELPEAGGYLSLITRPVDLLSQEASVQLCRRWAKKQGIQW